MDPLPTVREMGRLALPLGTRLAAGELGLERAVRFARTGGALSPLFPTLNADEVALLDLPLVQSSNPSLTPARVVRELSRLRVAALVVKGILDAPTLREADRTNTPLYLLPDTAELPRVSRAILRLIEEREAQEESQAAALYRLLSQQAVGENGLSDLVHALHEVTGHTVTVTTAAGEMLEARGSAPEGAVERTTPVIVGDRPAAFLTYRDLAARMDSFTRVALEQGALALALALAQMEAVEAARSGVQLEFLTALLRGEPGPVLLARARAADYTLDRLHWVVLGTGGTRDEIESWLRRASSYAEEAGWSVQSSVTADPGFPGGVTTISLVVLSGGGEWGHAHRALLERLRESWTVDDALALAAGDPAYGVEGLQRSLSEARDALALGLRLWGAGGDYLHRELGVYRLLRHLQGTADLSEFLGRTLGPLEAYDREHHGGLMATLEVLLEHGGNVSATAKAMHLHRNSVIYRVERIREVSGLEPTKAEDGFVFRLALMLAPLR